MPGSADAGMVIVAVSVTFDGPSPEYGCAEYTIAGDGVVGSRTGRETRSTGRVHVPETLAAEAAVSDVALAGSV